MGNEISTAGGAVGVVGTSAAAAVTFGQCKAVNKAVKETAKFTGEKFMQTNVRHVGQTVGLGVGTAATGLAAGVCCGKVKGLNKATVTMGKLTGGSGVECGKTALQTTSDLADGLPVVGHIKGAVHYAAGDKAGGNQAMKASSRTVGVVGGAVGGFFVGGPVGAAVGGVAGGAALDGTITGVDSAIAREYKPHGQIAAWTEAVAGESAQARIGGIVGVVAAPLMDAAAGYTVGKTVEAVQVRAARAQQVANQQAVVEFLENGGNLEFMEAMEFADQAPPEGHFAPARLERPAAEYDGEAVPPECWAEDGEVVYRGDRRVEHTQQQLFQDGIEPHGGGVHGEDAFLHTENAAYHQHNFVSTSRSYALAKEFGACGNHKRPRAHMVTKIRVQNGVDINATAQALGRRALYPGQVEVSVHGGVAPNLIEGVLKMPANGQPVWSPNPNFAPPQIGPQQVFYIRQTPAFPVGELVAVTIMDGVGVDERERD